MDGAVHPTEAKYALLERQLAVVEVDSLRGIVLGLSPYGNRSSWTCDAIAEADARELPIAVVTETDERDEGSCLVAAIRERRGTGQTPSAALDGGSSP